MSAWTTFCRHYTLKKNQSERTVYSLGRCYKGCYSQHLYWVIVHKWYRRMSRTFYRIINATDNPIEWDTKKIVKRVSRDAKYNFKHYKEYLR